MNAVSFSPSPDDGGSHDNTSTQTKINEKEKIITNGKGTMFTAPEETN